MIRIFPASPADAAEILAIQKRAFALEALRSDVPDIPPVTESLEAVTEHIRSARVLKAVDGERIVGSIRGVMSGTVCGIKALSIELDFQGRGLGSELLAAIEQAHPEAASFELFTNAIMEQNVRFYLRRGYEVIDEFLVHSDQITLKHFRKVATTSTD